MLQVIRYQCGYCLKKFYKSKSGAKQHEKICYWNPVTKSCITCNNQDLEICGKSGVAIFQNPIINCPDWQEMKYEETEGGE